jgi:SAM-dependent methyltransferase
MDTNRLKKFAVDARNKIKAGVEAKLSTLGFDSKSNVPDSMKPQLMQGGSLWNGQLMTEGFYHQWMALYDAVKKHGVHHIYEEAAYTWFNRLVAIRILQKNGIIEPVLTYVDEARTPKIVDDARSAGRIPPMSEADRQRLMELLDDDTKVTEQFAILISAYCHANPIIRQSFGRMADYTELLLPNNILAENGFIDDLNHTEFITNEDYKSSELIGWLYQFYISERKDEVFAKKGKYDADEIAPATQIFTPHWIVEYMVQNTIGRIYLDWHPEATEDFVSKWKYLVPQSEPRDISLPSPLERGGGEAELTDLRFADLGCGSGHILGYMFDILFDLYIYEGYTRKEAVENILRYNITGVDIDLRAKQLATFALLLKACQKDESFRDGAVLPHVLTMPEPIAEANRHQLFHDFFKGEETNNILAELDDAFDLLKDAQTLGSIMKFDLSKSTLLAIRQTMDYWKDQSIVPDSVTRLLPSFHIILALTQKYTALVMNPPYMGGSRFDSLLSRYVKDNYPAGKADLFSVFMLVAKDRLVPKGKYAMINMQSWMFLSSFEQLRKDLLDTMQIDSMFHLGPHTFDELSGEVVQNTAFVVSNINDADNSECIGTYYRLVDGKNCADKERMFLENRDGNVDAAKVYYPNVKQKDFEKIPGEPIGYWVSKPMLNLLQSNKLGSEFEIGSGLSTSDNQRFLRFIWEVSNKNTEHFGNKNSLKKWYAFQKGGEFRKWYGNLFYVVNWYNDGEEIKYWVTHNPKDPNTTSWSRRIFNTNLYLRDGITWSVISSGNISFRYSPKYTMISNAAGGIFGFEDNRDKLYEIIAALNSKIWIELFKLLNPTINYSSGIIQSGAMPKLLSFAIDNAKQNISISKLDWDAHETSWDFAENPLVAIMKQAEGEEPIASEEETDGFKQGNQWFATEKPMVSRQETDGFAAENCHAEAADATEASLCDDHHASLQQPCNDITKPLYDDYNALVNSLQGLCHPADGVTTHGSTLELCVNAFEKQWTARFMQLHANEEELNRQFIDIYGLQDELTSDVPLNEITILQQGEISIE